MSLLMDALKRPPPPADPPPAAAPLKLTPLEEAEPASPPATGLPNLAQHLDAVNADLAASLPAPPPRREQEQAREAFAARAPAPPAPESHPLRWLGLAGFILLLLVGAYFAWQWRTLNATGTKPAPPSAPPASIAAAPPAPTIPPALAGGGRPPEGVNAQDIRRSMQNQRLTHAAPEPAPSSATPPSDLPVLRLQRGAPPLDPALARGHAALEQGRVAQARLDFEQALQHDPHNLDALLSLAAIALREGRQPVALQLYQAALTAHPRDARALAGYLGLNGPRDPEGTESRLKTLLQEQPDAPALHFALGNLLAGQGRWHEAQAAYFQAWTLDGSNPDYRFNLAVSLDQLRQARPAADHYRQALEAARQRPAAFDPEQVRARLRQLEGSSTP